MTVFLKNYFWICIKMLFAVVTRNTVSKNNSILANKGKMFSTLEGHNQWASIYIWGTVYQVCHCWGNWNQWRDSLMHCKEGTNCQQPNSLEKNHNQLKMDSGQIFLQHKKMDLPALVWVPMAKPKRQPEQEAETTMPFQILSRLKLIFRQTERFFINKL